MKTTTLPALALSALALTGVLSACGNDSKPVASTTSTSAAASPSATQDDPTNPLRSFGASYTSSLRTYSFSEPKKVPAVDSDMIRLCTYDNTFNQNLPTHVESTTLTYTNTSDQPQSLHYRFVRGYSESISDALCQASTNDIKTPIQPGQTVTKELRFIVPDSDYLTVSSRMASDPVDTVTWSPANAAGETR